MKRRILREVTTDVSKFLLGYSLPQEIQSQISHLMQTSLLRRDFDLRYEITRCGEDRCILKVEGSFLVENFTNEPRTYTQTLAFEAGENPTILELRVDSDDEKVRYCLREGTGLTVINNGAVGPKCSIKPKAMGKTYRFGYRYSAEFPSSYPDILSFAAITSGVVIRIIHPPDIEVVADLDEACQHLEGRYEYRRVFLPSQHIRIRWKAKLM